MADISLLQSNDSTIQLVSKTISPNTTIAQYTIVSKIGEGGMGEVWRARDSKLGRDVAIKVLPPSLSENEDRLRRFEQEAQAAGALNHPNILVIYHIGTHEGAPYIVSELLEGETLRDRMAGAALPQRKAIDYALQIAKGLAAAHEKGIVHRDIKPDNVFVTNDGRVKILDFGLAKLTGASETQSQTEVPTRKVNTDPGTVMGTMGYMSPEQLKGQHVDHCSDIFSFGAILYEMLSGKRAFRGDSMAETMSAILREDPPDLSETNKTVSPALERVVRHCLEKNPAERFHSARDLAFAIESLSGAAMSSGPTLTMAAAAIPTENHVASSGLRLFTDARLAWIVAAVFALGLLTTVFAYFNRPTSSGNRAIWLSFAPPPNLAFNDRKYDFVIISPDGQKMAFTGYSPDGKSMLYVSELNSPEANLLPGTDGALEPFWSPDSRSIAFGSQGKLKRAEVSGGNSQILCDATRLTGGAWSKTGVIVFGPDYGSPLFQVVATGGEPKQVTFKEADGSDGGHRHPNFLPDGKHFLFYRGGPRTTGTWVGSLDSQELKQVLPEDSNAVYSAGYLLYVRNQVLVAQTFDADSFKLSGDVVPIVTGAVINATGQVRFSASEKGVMVWQGKWEREYQLVWFDREGKQTGALANPSLISVGYEPRFSPDGKRIVMKRDGGIWVTDLNGENGIRLGSGQLPVWSTDGRNVAFTSVIPGIGGGIFQKASNGVGEQELILGGTVFGKAWSPDGRFLIFMRRGVKTRGDVWVLPRFGDAKEFPLLASAADELEPELSPDSRWVAYISDESGTYEIYVQSFTAEGKLGSDRKRVSTKGGVVPNWSRDGKELFYVAGDGLMMSVSVKTSGTEFESSSPKALFKTRMLADASFFHEFDVSPDGQRFLIGTRIGDPKSPPPTVILNWMSNLKK